MKKNYLTVIIIDSNWDKMSRNINVLKVTFAMTFMGMAAYLIFSRLYFPKAGLSNSQFGLLFSIPGIVLILSQPAWSLFTDYTGSSKTNFQIMLTGSAGFLLIFYFAQDFFLNHFTVLLILMGLFALFYTARGPVGNSLALSFLRGSDEGFGRIRLWSSVGWAVAAILVAYFLSRTSLDLLFPAASVFFLASAIAMYPLKSPTRETLRTVNIFKSEEIQGALKNKRMWIFLSCLFLLWVGVSGAMIFLPIYLDEHFGFDLLTLGIFYAVMALAEVPFFYHGDDITESIGIRAFLIVGFAALSATWLILGLFTTPLMAFGILFIRGVGFSFVYLGSVNYMDMEVTEKTRTVGQSLFTMVSFGIAGVLGRSTFGFIADYLGLPKLYLIGGVLGAISTLGLILFWSVTSCPSREKTFTDRLLKYFS